MHDPLTAEEHNDLGVSYEEQGEYALAEREYKEALRLKETFFKAQFNLGNVYLKIGQEREAEKAYKKAIELAPDQPDAYNNLANLYLNANRNLDKAGELAEKAVDLSTSSKSGRYYIYLDTLGMIYLKRGKVDSAISYLEQALKNAPVVDKGVLIEIYKNLAQAYSLRGEEKQAQKYKNKVIELTGEEAYTL